LLADYLPADARYTGTDISSTMVGLARARLEPWVDRSVVHETSGGFDPASLGGPFDRVIATYVFDLLAEEQIAAAIGAAHAALAGGGLLCTAGLTKGTGPLSRAVSALWGFVRHLAPPLVGGCRPLVLADRLERERWRIRHREVVIAVGVPSEVLVAQAI